MRRRPPRSTQSRSSAASDVYKRQVPILIEVSLPARRWSTNAILRIITVIENNPSLVTRVGESLAAEILVVAEEQGVTLDPVLLNVLEVTSSGSNSPTGSPSVAPTTPDPTLSLIHISEPTRPY
eukprot:TRINITY_DN14894_c0_g1_i1.p2 TRINITY_DN14894_c0_g1~~TRINITY_DN14894_c0_g1_i1.p2  ORF type:complete len:124 (-),score=42.97 TRINITY_DN14894_c0_g1_i1:52-423(-)